MMYSIGPDEPGCIVHRLTLTAASIIALGAVSTKQVQVSPPAGYRLHLLRVRPGGAFTFTDDLSGMARLDVSIDFDGEAISGDFPIAIDAVHETLSNDFGKLAPEQWLGRAMGELESAPTGFTLRSVDGADDSAGPTFDTIVPADPSPTWVLEIHFLLAKIKEISL